MARVPSTSASSENPSRARYSPTSSASSASSSTRRTRVTALGALGDPTCPIEHPERGSRTSRTVKKCEAPGRSEAHRQCLQAAQREALAVLRLRGRQLELRHAAHERADRDLSLDARQRRPEAEMDAPAEGDVPVVGATD